MTDEQSTATLAEAGNVAELGPILRIDISRVYHTRENIG